MTRDVCVCRHRLTHEEDNFIVNHDVHKGELFCASLYEEYSPQRPLITKINGIQAVEEDFSKTVQISHSW